MAEEKVKFQHYVPRVYLKNFSNFNGKEYYIFGFDKKTEKIFQTNIKDIAFEEEFYNKVSEEQVTEKILRDIETKVDKSIQKLISNKDINKLDDKDRDLLSEFIAYQMIRTRETREELKDIPKQILQKFGDQMAPSFKNQVLGAMQEESLREIHKEIIGEMGEFKERIKKMKWILIINKSKFPFWTSDNPIAEYNKIDLSPYGNLGLNCPGFELHIPLSSKLCLIICDPIAFQLEPNKKITKDYRHIVRERDLQVRYSTRFIFSNEKNFDLAKMIIKEHPTLKDPDRKRVKVN